MAMAMAAGPRPGLSANRIVVAIDELAPAGRALAVAARLVNGDTDRITVFLTQLAASDPGALKRLYKKRLKGAPGRVKKIPDYDAGNLAAFATQESAAMLVLSVAPGVLAPENLQVLRQKMRCPVCLVR
jgi:hypothetical protein